MGYLKPRKKHDEAEKIKQDFAPLWVSSYPSIPDGWLPILRMLCEKIEKDFGGKRALWEPYERIEAGDRDFRWPHFSDVKEKYGTLSLNGYYMTDRMFNRLNAAERLSGMTCQECGKKGYHIPLGWYHTVCKKHASPDDLEYIRRKRNGLQRAASKIPL